ncbi:MAG TPA: SHOCT domain-containing protein [Epsilonproteobacteria bacterium]|nr:SHOCT domain-containing protein [Campylobacterota bacterium]
MQMAFQYTLFLSFFYVLYKFFDINSPKGSEFISYIIPTVMTNVVLIVFPILFVFFYFKDSSTIEDMKETFSNKNNTQINELNNQDMLREYHGMLKDGVITQEEYDNIKKKYLKDVHKNI